jgi:hypothetical protein
MMNEAKALFVIRRALQKSQGAPVEQQAEDVVEALTLVLAAEQYCTDEHDTVGLDMLSEIAPKPAAVSHVLLPSSPAVAPAPSLAEVAPEAPPAAHSLIVTPEEARRLPAPEPAGTRRRPIQRPNVEKKFWSYETLIRFLEQSTPPVMEIVPEGTDVKLPLARNIVAGIGMDAVKLIYQMVGLEESKPWIAGPDSTPASLNAENAPAMKIDLPVCQTFFLTDKDQPVAATLSNLATQASKLYAFKGQPVVNRAPIRTGPLGFSARDPHEDV